MKKIRENELNSLSLSEKLDHVLHALGVVEKNESLLWKGNQINTGAAIAEKLACHAVTTESIKKYRIVPKCPFCGQLVRNDDGKCNCGAVMTPAPT